jgi:methylation protein EvaC
MADGKCLVCAGEVSTVLDFGRMPIANGFLSPADFGREFFFDLAAGRCEACGMVQLVECVDPAQLFHGRYAYHSSISVRMAGHFQHFADAVRAAYLGGRDPLVVEIGSNDGILLRHFAAAGVRHLGVEPSANVARAAIERGVRTIVRFFDETTAAEIRREHGPADVVLGANVICHVPDLPALVAGVTHLLSDRGVFVFEEPYLGDIVETTAYDQIYDEHVFYFCLDSLARVFARHDLEIVDVGHQDVHGGSMRYTVARRGARAVAPGVAAQRAREAAMGLGEAATYARLRERVHRSRDALVALLRDLRRRHRVVAYGATSKSTTVTNFCGLGPDLIEYVSDTTPGKQGTYTPGVHIPVVPWERFRDDDVTHALLFAWNHGAEIIAKEQSFLRRGGRFVVYVPDVGFRP